MFFYFCNNNNNNNIASSLISEAILDCWIESTNNDPNLFEFQNLNKHDDGWGMWQYIYYKLGGKISEEFKLQKNSNPAFLEKPRISFPIGEFKKYFLLLHARKASPNMPISLNQNHPFANESGNLILIHNGTLNKDLLLSLLNNKPSITANNSDTQLFFQFLKQKFEELPVFDDLSLFLKWEDILSSVKNLHQQNSFNFSMNLLFLVKNPENNNFFLLYSSLYSNLKGKSYFDFFHLSNQTQNLICSSTIKENFERKYPELFETFEVKLLPNNTIGLINLDSLNMRTKIIY
jgi:predicted glutamine amidotransferase